MQLATATHHPACSIHFLSPCWYGNRQYPLATRYPGEKTLTRRASSPEVVMETRTNFFFFCLSVCMRACVLVNFRGHRCWSFASINGGRGEESAGRETVVCCLRDFVPPPRPFFFLFLSCHLSPSLPRFLPKGCTHGLAQRGAVTDIFCQDPIKTPPSPVLSTVTMATQIKPYKVTLVSKLG